MKEENEPWTVSLVKDIYDWSTQTAERVYFGTGKEIGSFTFHYFKGKETIYVFQIYTDGWLALNYGSLKDKTSEETAREYQRMILEIPTFHHISSRYPKWSYLDIDALKEKENLEKFKKAVEWLGTRIRSE